MHITFITPTYNRAHTLERVYSSLSSQSCKDFDWLIIDDGSTDRTSDVVETFQREADFEITYVKKHNEGKSRSLNLGYSLCKGDLTVVFDSDDWCSEKTVELFYGFVKKIPSDELNRYSGVSVLKAYKSGAVVGDEYPEQMDSYVERSNLKVKGDKWDLIRKDVAQEYPFPVFGDERYIAPSSMLLMIGRKYKTKFINEVLGVIEYMDDGISRNNIKHRAGSPLGCCYTYDLIFDVSDNFTAKLRARTNFFRFYFRQRFFTRYKVIDLLACPLGFVMYIVDNVKLLRIGGFNWLGKV